MKLNPLLQSDFYKQCHWNQYPKDVTKVVSYFTPRMSRLRGQTHLVMFGLQGFIKEFLIEEFNENFFNRPLDIILEEYSKLDYTFDKNLYGIQRIKELHQLGYLPIEIKALPEGARIPVGVPMFEISNTHPDFAWLTNALETAISCEMWHAMQSANVGYMYREIVNKYYNKTCDDSIPRARALGDFSMRGQESMRSACKSSAAWLLSFLNTATVPAIYYLEKYYNCDVSKEKVGYGAVSTEHSVMCSNFAVDGDEITMLKRLLTEIYPETSFSMVSDSYDYWNLVENILPQCKEEIMNHKGCLLVRGDSGDPVEVTTKTVFKLGEIFGYTTNTKGYKVLPPYIKAIYGDSITPSRCENIYQILEREGWACSNVSLGVGSFSMQCLEEVLFDGADGTKLNPYTRDTFGIAIKATYCEDKNGRAIPIFKNPKEGGFKKSHKGCCVVYTEENKIGSDGNIVLGDYYCEDERSFQQASNDPNNKLKPVFRDGNVLIDLKLEEIRNRLHKGEF